MKKETLYDIYDSIDNAELITNNLYDFLEKLNSNAGRIFLSFVKNTRVDEETIGNFIELSQNIDLCEFDRETEEELVNIINRTLMNDYVSSDDDFEYIVDNYSILLENDAIDAFIFDTEEEVNYYKMFVIREFNRILNTLGNQDMEKLYTHDMCLIIDNYKEVLDDLKNTTSISNMGYNDKLRTRIKYFVDIISDMDTFELDDKKFKAVITVAVKTPSLEKLKVLRGIIKFSKMLDYDEFIDKIDMDSAELNEITVDRILRDNGINQMETEDGVVLYIRNVEDPEKEREVAKKILKP